LRTFILWLFGLHFIFLAYLNNVYLAGLPVRSFLILLAGGLVLLLDSSVVARLRPVNVIYVLLAILGLVVSLTNNVGVGGIISGEMRLLQSYLLLMVAYFILEQYGFRVLAFVLLSLALPSALIGILQGLGVHVAWEFHAILQEMQNKEISDEMRTQMAEVLDRPPGLTLYAIPQTYMLLSAMALMLYWVIKNPANQRAQWVGGGRLRHTGRRDFCVGNPLCDGGCLANASLGLFTVIPSAGDSAGGGSRIIGCNGLPVDAG
jgi:hypothetical protein